MKAGSTKMLFAAALGIACACAGRGERVPHSVVEQMPPVNLPELMKAFDGTEVKSAADWEAKRRPELLDFFARNMHGVRPVERPADLTFTRLAPDGELMDGLIVRKQVRATFSGPRGKWGFNILAFLPKSDRPVPSFVLICNRALQHNIDPELKIKSEFCPAEALARRGFGLVLFKNTELALDEYMPSLENGKVVVQDPPFTNGLYACFAPERTYRSWGAISAWAWGASRVMDWIETEPAFDAAHVAVIGHSRGGKTSLWAGATDPRFALVCVNDSGCCGAKLNHVPVCLSETIALDNLVNPHWFCRAYREFNGRDAVLPFDQHWLAALIAPRLLYIASATADLGAGPWGEFLTARHASPAWELYGKKGLVEDGPYLPETPFHRGCVGHHLRRGPHDLNLYDWHRYMDFAERHGWRPAPPAVAERSGGMKARYLDFMERAVAAYTPEHIRSYLESVERNGLAEHGFPRLTANIGVLLARGRRPVGADLFPRMMDACCGQMATAKKRNGNAVGNDFAVKEIVLCLQEVTRAKLFPAARTDAWRRALAQIVPEDAYTVISRPDAKRAQNWAVFTAASEQARLAAGIGGDAAFVEGQIANQLRFFDANGMYKDPNQPMVYDGVTRLQFALALWLGYNGPSRNTLEEFLRRSAGPTLKMQSVTGEIPFGGRSNQFLHNEAFWCALCEWYASWCSRRRDMAQAARFRRAAVRAADAVDAWLRMRPVRHVKNRYPTKNGYPAEPDYGCEGYAYFDKYMVTMGSWMFLANLFCDESIPIAPEDGAPSAFVTGPDFHRVMLSAGSHTVQFDLAADAEHDANGLGRIHRRGAPSPLCLSTPAAVHPHYALDVTNATPFAILPGFRSAQGRTTWLYDAAYACRGTGTEGNRAWADLSVTAKGGERVDWHTEVSAAGVRMTLSGVPEPALILPAFLFDGARSTRIACSGDVLEVELDGWVCRYRTTGKLTDTGLVYGNRNGHYRRYETSGPAPLTVTVTIEPSK